MLLFLGFKVKISLHLKLSKFVTQGCSVLFNIMLYCSFPFLNHFLKWFYLMCKAGSVIITSFQDIIKKEGIRGMYRGLSPTILALLPTWAVRFCSIELNETVKSMWSAIWCVVSMILIYPLDSPFGLWKNKGSCKTILIIWKLFCLHQLIYHVIQPC